MTSLTQVSVERRDRLMAHVDSLPGLADAIAQGADGAEARLASEEAFLVTSLVPLMDATERLLYPELDRLLSCRLAMTPMEREHAEVRRLIGQLGCLRTAGRTDTRAGEVATVLGRLHALLASHLADESSYARILERNVDGVFADALAGAMPAIPASV